MYDKNLKYDWNQLRRDLQDEYLAAMVVGFDQNTPDLMDIQWSSNEMLASAAEELGYNIDDYEIKHVDEEEMYRLREKAIQMGIKL